MCQTPVVEGGMKLLFASPGTGSIRAMTEHITISWPNTGPAALHDAEQAAFRQAQSKLAPNERIEFFEYEGGKVVRAGDTDMLHTFSYEISRPGETVAKRNR